MSVRDRPARPGDGSGICDPPPTRAERDRRRLEEQRARAFEAAAGKHRRQQEGQSGDERRARDRPTDEELAAREPERPEWERGE